MRLACYFDPKRGVRAAFSRGETFHDVSDCGGGLPHEMIPLLALGQGGLQMLRQLAKLPRAIDFSVVSFAPPVMRPSKVICIGLNYADHAKETGKPIPSAPVVFSKFPSALLGHQGVICLPSQSSRIDYEAELVVVIGKRGRNIPEASALEYVAGYTCGNDVSARDIQFEQNAGQWLWGKTFDTFAPIGPAIVTADEIPDAGNLRITLTLNGEVMQNSSTQQFLFSIPKVIAYLSRAMTLEVGDLIFTGTPSGVGDARKPPVYLQPGDNVCVNIESVGTLENKCEPESG